MTKTLTALVTAGTMLAVPALAAGPTPSPADANYMTITSPTLGVEVKVPRMSGSMPGLAATAIGPGPVLALYGGGSAGLTCDFVAMGVGLWFAIPFSDLSSNHEFGMALASNSNLVQGFEVNNNFSFTTGQVLLCGLQPGQGGWYQATGIILGTPR